ncbi:hypothetical protein SAMN06297129_2820 [Pseudooceanicola antarcticus]|uniref:NADH dehydrogenase subunit E n=1 Tax=Pseudooceanicola antarcticus TaxID=1247613 RepID=A0A285J270_9RHOB|nr:hypothetical protein [Pseudooceanicola antarcticus]PJE29778.1 hypothetical protein CVM39_07700 [Pseudooceanicola antarcticus]SNY54415.1 hypothetical protein SAMN06297129_2820 [Pseudooceanicola antarcticus]
MVTAQLLRLTAPLAALALAACTAGLPEDLPAGAAEGFNDAVASVGCVLRTERDYLPVELQTGLTREQAIEMAQYKIATGDAVSLPDGAVQLVVGECAA